MRLTITQKDALYDLIEQSGLSPSQFELKENASTKSKGKIATDLLLKKHSYFFSFETGPYDNHYAIYCPGPEFYEQEEDTKWWEQQMHAVKTWLRQLVKELNSPNKWDRLNKEIKNAGINLNGTNNEDKFSIQEYEELKTMILTLKQNSHTIGLTSEQSKTIESKLDHLTEMAKVLNKFDWRSLFVGTIISVIIQLNVTQANANSLWALIKQTFNNLLVQ